MKTIAKRLLNMASSKTMSPEADYEKRIKEQIDQYKNVSDMHAALSDMHEYWKRTHLVPVWLDVCEAVNVYDFYAKNFIRGMNETGSRTIASLGSGDGRLEISIAQRMKALGAKDFTIQCVELSEHQTARGDKHAADAGVTDCVEQVLGDFNKWESPIPLAGVMGHHALHHVADLETMFDNARKALAPHGKFVTIDVIGRNGHMRWPETLDIVESIWNFLPMDKRYHHIFKKTCETYLNHDCSTQGFEGIRAQDILPLMNERFEFENFYAYGGITEAIINRGYGANFDADNAEDRAFVDFLHKLNELLIDLGHVKPTVMFACASPERTKELRIFKNRTPEFCIRDTSK